MYVRRVATPASCFHHLVRRDIDLPFPASQLHDTTRREELHQLYEWAQMTVTARCKTSLFLLAQQKVQMSQIDVILLRPG